MKALSLVFFASLALTGLANASITVSTPTVTASGANYMWNYGISGDGQEQLVSGNYATCASGAACGTFFTIYDFQGYVSGSISAPTNWTATVMLTGLTPNKQIVTDSNSIVNLVFTYNGPTTPVPAAVETGFSALSTLGGINPNGTFSYEAQKITNTSASDQGQGPLNIPASSVPEPATLTAAIGGLLFLSGCYRKRKA